MNPENLKFLVYAIKYLRWLHQGKDYHLDIFKLLIDYQFFQLIDLHSVWGVARFSTSGGHWVREEHFLNFPHSSIIFSHFPSIFPHFLSQFGQLTHPGRPWLHHCIQSSHKSFTATCIYDGLFIW